MSEITPSTDKWFSVYVPRWTDTANAFESYFRMGTPDVATEAARLSDLQSAYSDALAQPGVEAAFGGNATSGVAFYTEGDLVQFVNGKVDTRVLNDSFTVHVLNKADVDKAGQDPTKAVTTHRSYFRLGKPNKTIETQIKLAAPSFADLLAFTLALALAPTPTSPISVATRQATVEAVLAGDVSARSSLVSAAESGDPAALQSEALAILGEGADAMLSQLGKPTRLGALGDLAQREEAAARGEDVDVEERGQRAVHRGPFSDLGV